MKILVTGATGLLGNNIVRQLLAAGEDVRVLTRASSDSRPLAGLTLQRVEGDVRDSQAVSAACRQIDVVIHAAGLVHFGWTQSDLHRQINIEGTRNVAAAARAAGARLVHISSVDALGLGRLTEPADEETALAGIVPCPYPVTKRQGDEVVLNEARQGLSASIIHPAFMLGPWDWKPSSGKMLLEVTRFAPVAPAGAASFCDVRDVAAGVISAVHRGTAGRRYILGGHNLTYWEAWQKMARLVGKRGPFLRLGPLSAGMIGLLLDGYTRLTGQEGDANSAALAGGIQQHCFSSNRAIQELGYRIRPWEQTLQDGYAWFREHGYIK